MTEVELVWARRVAEWKASGLTSRAFCEGKPFSDGGLRHWATRLRKREAPAARTSGREVSVRLARVVREGQLVPPDAPLAAVTSAPTPIIVVCGNLRVEVRPGFDRDTMSTLLDLCSPSGAAR